MIKLKTFAIFLLSTVFIAAGTACFFKVLGIKLSYSGYSNNHLIILAIVSVGMGCMYFIMHIQSLAFPRGAVLENGASILDINVGSNSIAVLDEKRKLVYILYTDTQRKRISMDTVSLREFRKLFPDKNPVAGKINCYERKKTLEPDETRPKHFKIHSV